MDYTIQHIDPEQRCVAVVYHCPDNLDRLNNLFVAPEALESEPALLAALSDHARHYEQPAKQAPGGLTSRRFSSSSPLPPGEGQGEGPV
jgi:hypothetical protein